MICVFITFYCKLFDIICNILGYCPLSYFGGLILKILRVFVKML
ncbi:MAG: hypothetical protein PG977_000120 [Bartonella clarridgeiae]|nr:MAG: hypothetical protein PG977_000120 [Bartonella clarridgeiae]